MHLTVTGPGALVSVQRRLWNYLPGRLLREFCLGTDAVTAAGRLMARALLPAAQYHVAVIPIRSSRYRWTAGHFRLTSTTAPLHRRGFQDGGCHRQRHGAQGVAIADGTDQVEAIIIDCSTSMRSPATKFDEAKQAHAAAIG